MRTNGTVERPGRAEEQQSALTRDQDQLESHHLQGQGETSCPLRASGRGPAAGSVVGRKQESCDGQNNSSGAGDAGQTRQGTMTGKKTLVSNRMKENNKQEEEVSQHH
ncbi:unnamed protein product [Pleuronectes platessa]|uniref:Uncharacterized protein n=1 Tax=Pleuronectes platessa TaxID=8262 RepID=A0A9N7Z5M7_PLEPL|nr:unnamed protein product [Pleuronectes platessa]